MSSRDDEPPPAPLGLPELLEQHGVGVCGRSTTFPLVYIGPFATVEEAAAFREAARGVEDVEIPRAGDLCHRSEESYQVRLLLIRGHPLLSPPGGGQ